MLQWFQLDVCELLDADWSNRTVSSAIATSHRCRHDVWKIWKFNTFVNLKYDMKWSMHVGWCESGYNLLVARVLNLCLRRQNPPPNDSKWSFSSRHPLNGLTFTHRVINWDRHTYICNYAIVDNRYVLHTCVNWIKFYYAHVPVVFRSTFNCISFSPFVWSFYQIKIMREQS